jgi:hypothetical protein
VGGLRRRGPVTWPFALPRPALSRRPRAVSSGCGVARRRARAQACRTVRSTDLQLVPVLTSFSPPACFLERRPSSPSASDAGIHSRSSTALTGRLRFRSLAVRALVRPSVFSERASHEVPGFRGRLLARPARALGRSRRCCRGSPLVGPSRPPGGETALALRRLLAANQWIAETSAVVEPILRRPSPHSLPLESLLVPGAKARPISLTARKRGAPAKRRGPHGDRRPRPDHSDRRRGRQRGGLPPGGDRGGIL